MRQRVAVFAVAGLCILAAGCGAGNQAGKTSRTTTTTSIIARPVVEREIDTLLLSPEQIDVAMAAKDMKVTKKRVAMPDDSATMKPRECLAIDGSAQAQVYDGSGFTAVRDEALNDGDNFTHFVEQAVVLFPIAKQANAFFTAAAQQWPACHHYSHIQSGTQWTVGPISDENGTLSTVATQEDARAGGWACGRALEIRNNIIVDVNTCSANPGNTAVDIANQIAAKVPTR